MDDDLSVHIRERYHPFLQEMTEEQVLENFKQDLLHIVDKIYRNKYYGFNEQESVIAPCSLLELKKFFCILMIWLNN